MAATASGPMSVTFRCRYPGRMKAAEVMTPEAQCVAPDQTLTEAAKRLRYLEVGALPVCENDRLIGMITDRDITVRAVATGLPPEQTQVRAAMSPGVIYAFEDQDVKEVSQLMAKHQIRRLPVLNRQKRLVGMIALGDLAMETSADMAGRALQAISLPTTGEIAEIAPSDG